MRSIGWDVLLLAFVYLAAAQITKKCASPPEYQHARLHRRYAAKKEFRNGMKVYYKCAEDSTPLTGSRAVQCWDGTWTKLTLKCEKRTCGYAGDLPNGQFEYGDSAYIGDKVNAVCNKGYTLKGPSFMTCKKSGWRGKFPSCEGIQCGSAGEIIDGEFTYTGVEFGDTATAVCNEGHRLVGKATRNCLSKGWDGRVPLCEAVACDDPPVTNAEMEGHQGSMYTYRRAVRYRCKEGTLNGPRDIWCTSDGTWNARPPTCEVVAQVTCATPAVKNSVSSGGGVSVHQVGDDVSFTCNQGFQLHGAQRITCGPDGRWQTRLPQCLFSHNETPSPDKERGCGVPETSRGSHASLADKYITMTSFASDDRVDYVCDVGYVPARGRRHRVCSDGKWTPLQLTCERIQCGSAGEIIDGEFTYTGVEFGDTATAVCNEGHRLVGKATRNCLSKGWDGRVPLCEAVVCDDPPVTNAEMEGHPESTYTYRRAVRYRCKVGTLNGTRDIWCTSDGTWNAHPPTCEVVAQVTCATPAVKNSVSSGGGVSVHQVGDDVSFTCNQGFQLHGAQRITCGPDGRWQTRPPQCLPSHNETPSPDKERGCGVPETSRGSHASLADKYITMTSFASDDRVDYVCDVGYVPARGRRHRVCSDGKWTPLQLTCERIQCGSAGEIIDGEFTYTGVEFGDTATAVCDEGHRLVGKATRNCLSKGWDGRVPLCEAVVCDDPPVTNAEMEGHQGSTYTYRRAVRYRCKVGTLNGPRDIWCTSDGTWNARPPTCEVRTCPSPNVSDAFWSGAPERLHQYRDTLMIECKWGYRRLGPSIISCGGDGQWTPFLPTCSKPLVRRLSG